MLQESVPDLQIRSLPFYYIFIYVTGYLPTPSPLTPEIQTALYFQSTLQINPTPKKPSFSQYWKTAVSIQTLLTLPHTF